MNFVAVEIDPEQRAELETLGIDLFSHSEEGFDGVYFEEQFFVQALDLLEMEEAARRRSAFEGIIIVTLVPRGAAGPPGAVKAAGRGPARMTRVIEQKLAPVISEKLRRPIVVHFCGGKMSDLVHDGAFHLHLWGGLHQRREVEPPRAVGKIRMLNRKRWFSSSGRDDGIVIRAAGGHEVAELIGHNLYVFPAVYTEDDKEEENFLSLILDAAIPVLGRPKSDIDAERQRQRKEAPNPHRDQYVALLSGEFADWNSKAEKEAEASRKELALLQAKLVEVARRAKEAERRFAEMDEEIASRREHLAQEFDNLLAAPGVEDLSIDQRCVTVFTKTLNCLDPRSQVLHEIGRFRIEIPFTSPAGDDDGVRWYNLTRQVRRGDTSMHAPHVSAGGKACLGTLKGIIPGLMAKYQITEAVLMVIKFIESVNVNDNWGKDIVNWPRAEGQATTEAVR